MNDQPTDRAAHRSLRRDAARPLAPQLPPRRRHRAVAAAARRDDAGVRRVAPTAVADGRRAASRGGCSPSATTSACCRNTSSRRTAGRDYALSPYLELLEEHRNDFTVFSGVSHPDVDGGHPADNCFLTAAPHPGQRRVPQHDLARPVHRRAHRPPHAVPVADARRQRPAGHAQPVVDRLGRADPVRGEGRRTSSGGCSCRARRPRSRRRCASSSWARASSTPWPARRRTLQRSVGARDRDRLDQYFTSVRDLEQRHADVARVGTQAQADGQRRRPARSRRARRSTWTRSKLMYDMARLAFETDSTRSITLLLDSVNSPAIELDGREDHRRLPQPLAPRQVRGEARAARRPSTNGT